MKTPIQSGFFCVKIIIMFWADKLAKEIISSEKYKPYRVDDMKTPSGKIHVGSIRGVVIHDLIHKALIDNGAKSVFTYVINDMDPMDGLPVYLPKEKYLTEMGKPLFQVPSPKEGHVNYARYYADEFIEVIRKIGADPQIIWSSELYGSGKMDESIKMLLDNSDKIKKIYEDVSGSRKGKDWYPYCPICPKCGKVGSTKVTGWDGIKVKFVCLADLVDWAEGCGYEGTVNPVGLNGKLPWKLDWAAHWKTIGVTIEWSGKDHMSQGGSHQVAGRISEEILDYPVPQANIYEHFLLGGAKMSSSKGIGISAREIIDIIPPSLVRFLMARVPYERALSFDPKGYTIPDLFDEFDKCAKAYWEGGDSLLSRIFEFSQIDKRFGKAVFLPRFRTVANSIQLQKIDAFSWFEKEKGKPLIDSEKEILEERIHFAKIWLEKFAPDSEKFILSESIPEIVSSLSDQQRKYLQLLIPLIQEGKSDAERLQVRLYEISKEINLPVKDAFSAIYLSLIGKSHGPKAAWFISNIPPGFIIKRFESISSGGTEASRNEDKYQFDLLNNEKIFSIDSIFAQKYPSLNIGIAIIKGVKIEKTNPDLEAEKEKVLKSLAGLTTEMIGQSKEILSYRRLYKETGVDWHSRRPSPEALLRRVALGKGLYTVNTCVDAYNLVVMKNRVSSGAFDLDKLKFPAILRFAKKGEEILLLGDDAPTPYEEGEVAYFDENGGFNMDFNYRDAKRSLVTEKTANLYINIDGVYDVTREMVEKTLKETIEIIQKYCGGNVKLAGIVTATKDK